MKWTPESNWGKGLALLALLLAASALVLLLLAGDRFGAGPDESPEIVYRDSSQFRDGRFRNPRPLYNDYGEMWNALFRSSPFASPTEAELDSLNIEKPRIPDDGDGFVWLGHSSLFLRIGGKVFLVDPVFDDRASPWSFLGPTPWYPAPLVPRDIPRVDWVLISHDHYDHLSRAAIAELEALNSDVHYIVPVGVQFHLLHWGVSLERITVLDWWQSWSSGGTTVTATPSRHASGRHLLDQDATLWAGFAIHSPSTRIWYSGDTGWMPEFEEIGEKLGPFDAAFVEVGAYDMAWPDWHLGPENALMANIAVKSRVFIPVHWGRFTLSGHGWTEPVERSILAASAKGIRIHTPVPGAWHSFSNARQSGLWWPNLPWTPFEEHPVFPTAQGRSEQRLQPYSSSESSNSSRSKASSASVK